MDVGEGHIEGRTISWLRGKAEAILRRKEAFGIKTTLSLCSSKKGSLQEKATNSDTLCIKAPCRKGHFKRQVRQENNPNRFKSRLLQCQKNQIEVQGDKRRSVALPRERGAKYIVYPIEYLSRMKTTQEFQVL